MDKHLTDLYLQSEELQKQIAALSEAVRDAIDTHYADNTDLSKEELHIARRGLSQMSLDLQRLGIHFARAHLREAKPEWPGFIVDEYADSVKDQRGPF